MRNEVPSIRRFVNRDMLTGIITNSQSLNRYSYVQGNPVTLTDPFGLCPTGGEDGGSCDLGHTILDLVGIFWDGADVINGIWYAMEGNYFMAATCALSALPLFGSFMGGAVKAVVKNAKVANKAANTIQAVSKVMSHTATATMAAIDTGYAAVDAVSAAKAGNLKAKDVGNVVLNAAVTVVAGAATARSARKAAEALYNAKPISKAVASVSTTTTKLHNDVRSGNVTGKGGGSTVGGNIEKATVQNQAKSLMMGETRVVVRQLIMLN